jgi:hypothetical protein
MPTPYDAPYKIIQRDLRRRAKNKPYSEEWYKQDVERQKALVVAHRKMQAAKKENKGN